METPGEGLVAIVQGMQDAGLTVTVADARRIEHGIASCSAITQGPRKVSSEVQTCGPPSHSQANVFSPNPYPYQIAPHSAPPLQRQVAETSYTVPAQTNQYPTGLTNYTVNPATVSPTRPSATTDFFSRLPALMPVRDVQPYRSALVWDDRGGRSTRGTDAFAESLRKYPQCTERCTSADLIHRLLTYTQTKNFTKSSYHSKRLRSLRKQAHESPKDNVLVKRSTKNIQTYTRNRQESPSSSYHAELSSIYGKTERRRRAASPAKSDRGNTSSPTRQRADTLSTSYDYLKIGSPKFSTRSTDVRYLNDVTRYVKDTLRMIYDDQTQPQMCPRIASRYSQHRREHHQTETGTTTNTEAKNEKVQTMVHKRMSSLSPCNAPGPSAPQSTVRDMFRSNVLRRICRICQQPLPCECLDSSPSSPREIKRLKSLDLAKELLCRMCPSDEDDDCMCLEKIRIIVDEWLKEVPIYVNFTRQEKADREEIVNRLKTRIRLFIDDEANCKKEIMKCLRKLPMWLPSEEGDRQQFKENLTDKLWNMLRRGRDKDRVEEIVREWLTTVPFKTRPHVDKDRLAYDLTNKLTNVFAVHKLGELKDALKETILDDLNRLPIFCDSCDRDTFLPQLADKLVDNLLFEKINDDLRSWISNIPFKPTPPIDKEKLIMDLTNILKEIIEKTDPDMVREVLDKAIFEELSKLPVDCDDVEKDTYYQMLVDQLLHDLTRNKLSQSIRDWIDTISFKSRSKIDKEKLAVGLTKKLRDIIEMNGTVELKDALKKALVEESMDLPVDCDHSEKKKVFPDLAEPLVNCITNYEMAYVIRRWIKHIPFMTPPPVDKKKLIADLTKKLKKVVATINPEMLKETLEQTLLEELSKWPIDMDPSELNECIPELVSKLVDDLIKDNFSQKVRNWVNKIPFKFEEPVDKYLLASDLTKKLKEIVVMVHPDSIRDALKDVLLTELEEYLIDCDQMDHEESSEYFSALADTLIDNLAVDTIGQTVRNWTKAIPFKASPPVDKEKLAVNLTKEIRNIVAITGPAELKETLKQTLVEELIKLPVDCDPSEKESYITEIAESLADTFADNEIKIAVRKWVNRLHFEPTSLVDGENIILNLANKLKVIVTEADPDEFRSALEKVILEELQTLPIDCDPTLNEKDFPSIAEELIDAIMKDKLGETVRNWLESIPLLSDPPVDRDQLAAEITRKLRDIIMITGPQDLKIALKDALLIELEKFPIDCDPTEKEDLSSALADKLAQEIENEKISKAIQIWIQNIPFKSTSNIDKKKVLVDLTNKFKDILSMVDPTEVRDALKGAALQELLGLPLDYDPLQKDKYLPQLAGKLADNLTKDTFGQVVRNWIDNVPFDRISPIDKKEFTNNLVQQLRHTYARTEPHVRKNDLKQIILENLTNVALKCNTTEAENFADKLADELVKLPKKIFAGTDLSIPPTDEEVQILAWLKQRPEFDKMTEEDIKKALKDMGSTFRELQAQGLSMEEIARKMQDNAKQCASEFRKENPKLFAVNVTDWLKDIGPTLSKQESEKLVQEVISKLRELREGGAEESLVQDRIKKNIEEGFLKIFQERGKKVPDETIKSLAKNFYKQLFNTSPSESPKKKQLAQALQKDVENWLQDSPELEPIKKNKKIARYIGDKLANIKLTGIDDRINKEKMLQEIKNILKQEDTTLDSKTAEMLAENLFNKLKGTISNKERFSTAPSETSNASRTPGEKGTTSSSYPTTSVTPTPAATSASSSSVDRKSEPSTVIQRQVKDWVANISELTNNTPAEKKANENLVQQITTKIASLQTQDLDNKQLKRQIASELDSALAATGKTLDTETKNKLVDQLLYRLPSPTTRTASLSVDKGKKKTDSQEVMKKEISNWLQQMPAFSNNSPTEKKEIENIMKDLAGKLIKVNAQNLGDEESRQNMLNEIKGTLDTALQNKGIRITSKDKLNLANDLIDKLQGGVRRSSSVSFTLEPEANLSHVFRGTIEDWIEDIPALKANTTAEKKKNKTHIRNLGKRLSKLYKEGKGDPQIKNKMMTEINNTLDSLLDAKGKKLDQNTRKNIATMLLSNIIGTAEQTELRLFSTNSTATNEKKQDALKAAQRTVPSAKTLTQTAVEGREIKDKMLGEIQDQFNTALKTRQEYIDLKAKNQLAGQLVDNVFELDKLDNKLKSNIKTILQELPEVFTGSPADMQLLDDISASLANDLKNINPDRLQDDPESKRQVLKRTKDQLITAFEKRGGLDSKTAKQLAEKVLDNTTDLLKKIARETELLKTMQNKDPAAVSTTYMVSAGSKEPGLTSDLKTKKDPADFINTLAEKVNTWTESIPQLRSTSPYESEQNVQMSIAFGKELAELLAKGTDNPKIQEQILAKIKNELHSALNKRGEKLDPKTKKQLAEKLYHQVMIEVYKSPTGKKDLIEKTIIDWYEHILELSSGSSSEREHIEKISKKLAKKVRDLQILGESKNKVKARVKITVGDHLKSVFRDKGQYLDISTKDKLVDKLLRKLADIIVASDINEPLMVVQKTMSDWIDIVPELEESFFQTTQGDLFSYELLKNVTEFLSNGMDDKEIRWQVFKEIKRRLDIMLRDYGESINYRTKHQLAEHFFNNILESVKKNKRIKRKLQRAIELDVKKWIEDMATLYTNSLIEGETLKDNYLTKNNCLQSKGIEKKAVRDEILEDIIGQSSSSFIENDKNLNNKSGIRSQGDSLNNRAVQSVEITDDKINLSQVFQGDISAWLREIPETATATNTEKKAIEKITCALAKKLASIHLKPVSNKEQHQEMVEEIKDHLDDILDKKGEHITNKNKIKLAEKLMIKLLGTAKAIPDERLQEEMQRIKNVPVVTKKSQDNELQRSLLWEWFNNIPSLSSGHRGEHFKMIDKLNKEILNIQNMESNSEIKRERMEKEICNWLDAACYAKNLRLTRKIKYKLTKNLINSLKKSQSKNRTSSTEDTTLTNKISRKRYTDNTGTSKILNRYREDQSSEKYYMDKNKAIIEAKPLPHESVVKECRPVILGNNNYSGSEFDENPRLSKHNILSSHFAYSSGKGKYTKARCTSIKTSITDYYGVKRPSAHFTEKQPVVYYLGESSDSDNKNRRRLSDHGSNSNLAMVKSMSVKELSKEIDPDIQEKITSIIRLNIDKMNTPESDEVRQEILDILLDEVGLPITEAEDLVDSIVRRAEIKAIDAGNAELQLLAFIRDEITEFLTEFEIKKERQVELEAYLVELVTDKLLKGSLDAEARKEALAIIAAKGLLTKEQAEEMLDKLVGETRSMMLSSAISKSVSRIEAGNRTNRSSLTLKEQTTFEKKARRIITNFIYDHSKDTTEEQKETITMIVEDAIENLEDILTDTDLDGLEKRRQMVKECERQLGRLALDSNKPLPDLAEELMERLESINLKTSTPKHSTISSEKVFESNSLLPHPKTDSDAGLSSHLKDKARRPSQLKDDYSKKIERVTRDWLDELPLDLDTLRDNEFKDTMIKDLAGNVADRKQFLQLNPESKTTDADELEHLNYQCNRWLTKFFGGGDLNIANSRVDKLIAAIRGVAIPDMIPKKQNQTYDDALKDEIMKWVDTLSPDIEPSVNRHKMEQLAETLARRVKKHKGLPDAEVKIRKEIADILPSMFGDVNQDGLKRLESSLFHALDKKGFTDDSWVGTQAPSSVTSSNKAPSGEDAFESGEEILNTLLHEWLKQLPLYQTASPQDKRDQELTVSEMAKGLNKILDKTKLASNQEKKIKDEIIKHLPNIMKDHELKNDGIFINATADQLILFLKRQHLFQDLTGLPRGISVDVLAAVVDDWTSNLLIDVKTQEEKRLLEEAKKGLVSSLKRVRQQYHPASTQHEQALRDELKKFMKENITDPYKKFDKNYLDEKASELIKVLKGVPMQSAATKPENYKSNKTLKHPADLLYRCIEEWCGDLPVTGEPDKVQSIKQNLASRLINKIGELNMDPDIFNDDILYEDLLHDDLDRLLEEVPRNPELDKYLPALKKDLTSKIMEARQILRDELAGKAYKQQLRDTISTSMHLPKSLPPDERASLELLKDKVADAFINLNYSNDNEGEKYKYKKTISDEVDKFCDEILRNYPCAHLDSNKIKRDLFNALIRVPVPKDDSMKSEVEQSRMKDIINDWMKELPLRQELSSEKLLRYKLASILVKRLHDIELEKEINPYLDCDLRMSEDIGKFLGKLPIRYDQEDKIPDLVQKLLYKLKNSEQSRKFISARRSKSIETQADDCHRYPCTLNQRDKDHLIRIKERVGKRCYKDASVSPVIADSSCQTDLRDRCWPQPRSCAITKVQATGEKPCFLIIQKKDASCMARMQSPCYHPSIPSPCHMPNVIVKEYMWDSTDTSKLPHVTTATETRISHLSQPRTSQSGALEGPTESSMRESEVQTEEFSQQIVQPELLAQSSQQECQTQPVPQISRPCWCRPQQLEKEVPCQNTPPCATDYITPEPSSADEGAAATSKSFWRQSRAESTESVPPCPKDCKHSRPRKTKAPAEDPESDWPGTRFNDEDFWDTCWRHRGRKADVPHTKRRERMQEKMKCKCKERILVSCRGPNSRNRYHDMCQACGSSCPHPSFMYFK